MKTPTRRIADVENDISSVRGDIEELELELAELEDELAGLEEAQDTWPDKATLLAVYGAPGNWPVIPQDDRSGVKRSPLKADPSKTREWQQRSRTPSRRRSVSPASPEQRKAVSGRACVHCGASGPCDPAHLCSRAQGGCDDALCVLALCRGCHRAFDDGRIDLSPVLALPEFAAERSHMALHLSLPQCLHRLSGMRWVVDKTADVRSGCAEVPASERAEER